LITISRQDVPILLNEGIFISLSTSYKVRDVENEGLVRRLSIEGHFGNVGRIVKLHTDKEEMNTSKSMYSKEKRGKKRKEKRKKMKKKGDQKPTRTPFSESRL